MPETLEFAASSAALLKPYLPPEAPGHWDAASKPFVTLTFATSLDSSLSLAPGVRTRLSGPESKAMTHFLRSRHAAILVGINTMLADDPGLNCRISGATTQPRPIIIDPHLRWTPRHSDKVLQVCREGQGLAPFVLTAVPRTAWPEEGVSVLGEHGGRYIHVEPSSAGQTEPSRFDWHDILAAVSAEGLSSLMVEGGAAVINSLLHGASHPLVDSVIVTVAPTWLGTGGVVVSPPRAHDEQGVPVPAARLSGVRWLPFGEDVVLCGRLGEVETT